MLLQLQKLALTFDNILEGSHPVFQAVAEEW
jgi:hypothetical protein